MLTCHSNLCTHCGACEVICPAGIIKLNSNSFVPEIKDSNSCTECNLCNRVCPGIQVNFEHLARQYKIGLNGKYNPYLGNYNGIYLAKSNNQELVKQATAGGIITGLLHYCFEKGFIDGALVVRMSKCNPMYAEGYIAKSIEELAGTPQSKYQIVPLLQLIKEAKLYQKLAFVGAGCHVEALRKWGAIDPTLKKRIKYVLGIYCATGNNTIEGTQFLVNGLGMSNVKNLSYRDGDYPGGLRVDDGTKKVFLKKSQYKWFHLLFTEKRCMQCIDFTNELADVSVGDSYSLSSNRKDGKSVVILRTLIGENLFKAALSDGYIDAETVSPDAIIQSQRYQFNISKSSVPRRNQKQKSKGIIVPQFITSRMLNNRQTMREHVEEFMTFFIFNTRRFWIVIFKILPFSFFKLASNYSKRD